MWEHVFTQIIHIAVDKLLIILWLVEAEVSLWLELLYFGYSYCS